MIRISIFFTLFFAVTGQASIRSISDIASLLQQDFVLIDVREQQACINDGVKQALCLPASIFESGSGELPSFYHINWLLGTAGLNGSETLVVFSDKEFDRYLVSGILHLAGQHQTLIWSEEVKQLQQQFGIGSGRLRGNTRVGVFTAPLRDDLMITSSQLPALEAQGWELASSTKTVSFATNPIIVNMVPGVAVATFAQLLSMNQPDAKVVIDRYAGKAFLDYSFFQIAGLLLMALGVAAWMLSAISGKR